MFTHERSFLIGVLWLHGNMLLTLSSKFVLKDKEQSPANNFKTKYDNS
jgi:hypothetical protein